MVTKQLKEPGKLPRVCAAKVDEIVFRERLRAGVSGPGGVPVPHLLP